MRHQCPQLAAIGTIQHGFFTRQGGVSDGIFSSLNCGLSSGDDTARVLENRTIAADTLHVTPEKLCIASQVHSATVRIVESPWSADNPPEVDALVTQTPGIAVGVLTADCLPILLCDPDAPVVAAVHAGWKGAFAGVIEAALDSMQALGAEPGRITACIGPAIAQPSYEVDDTFYQRFYAEDLRNDMYFLPADKPGHYRFDLPGYGKDRLANAGVQQINILAYDTYMDEDQFYSFRRATHKQETAYGRQLSAITIRG